MDRTSFEELLCENKRAIERFVYYRLPSKADGDDVLQEVFLTAFQKFETLKDRSVFKSWLLRIARNKCNDYFRLRAKQLELPFDETMEGTLTMSRFGITESSTVRDTLEILPDKDKQVLYLYYFKSKPQAEIAKMLDIPVGTVKSRLYKAKQRFKEKYPFPPISKGANIMKKLPELMPEYKITLSEKKPFAVKWEELMGWFLIPKLGEKLSWGIYDTATRKCDNLFDMQVTGKAEVHGVEGVELTARESDFSKNAETIDRTFIAQLTDTHCRYLASFQTVNGIKKYVTFLDEDAFMPNWGFGVDNCGNETNIKQKGEITRKGNTIESIDKSFLLDIVGRYSVEINGRSYDTVCVMDIETYNTGVVSEQYLDKNGRTILWRRFNRDDWAFSRYKQKWSEKLPENDRLIINGKTYVNWYDCLTDYIQ